MYQRREHPIKVARGDRIPHRWVAIVARMYSSTYHNDPNISRLQLEYACLKSWRFTGGSVTAEISRVIFDTEALWERLEAIMSSGTHLCIVAHRALELWTVAGLWERVASGRLELTGFDPASSGLTPEGKRRRWRGVMVLENPPFVVQLRDVRTGATARLVDAANYGIPTVPMDADPEATVSELTAQVMSWTSCIRRLRLGTWQNTLASQAYYGWRRSYMTHAVVAHENTGALDLERLAYFGGRCECAFVGTVDDNTSIFPVPGHYGQETAHHFDGQGVHRLDLNCSYGAAALGNVPTMLRGFAVNGHDGPPPVAGMGNPGVIAAVEVETYRPCVPYSPLRDELLSEVLAGRPIDWTNVGDLSYVVYPVGRFRTVLCQPEIEAAARLGTIHRTLAMAVYELSPAFRKWSEWLWRERMSARLAGDRTLAGQLKLLPVLLFGKFAQRLRSWVDVPSEPSSAPYASWYDVDPETRKLRRWRSVGWRAQRLIEGGETAESCPMVSAWITSLARVRLLELMELAGPGNVYYWDTDSLWVNSQGRYNLENVGEVNPDALGKLKTEGHYKRVEFVGIKHYVADGKVTLAAMPDHCQTDGSLLYWWQKVEGFPAALPHRQPPRPLRHTSFRSVPLTYEHGFVGPDGWVKPFRLNHGTLEV